ncbi:Qat anti-phage system associated protein QatB [Oerskovia turbata]
MDPPADELPLDEPTPDPSTPVAAPARFRDARTSIGRYARSGDREQMRRALGHYVRSGYGGGGTMARRLSSTSRTAARLGALLQPGPQPDLAAARDAAITGGKNAQSVLDAIVEATSPGDGTQDAEASRGAVRDALSDVLERYPDADLLDLDSAQRQYVIERFVGLDVYNRFCLDLGKKLEEHASSAPVAASRFAEVREYIAVTVAAEFDKRWAEGVTPNSQDLARVTQSALREAFNVFEGYLQ